jgi:hypothetical protein
MENEAYNLLRWTAFTSGWILVGCYLLGIATVLYFLGKAFKWIFKT